MKYMADDYEQDQGPNMTLIYMALIMSTVILVVVGMMFLVNKPTKSSSNGSHAHQIAAARENNQTQAMVDSVKALVSGSTLTSNQLDIWNLPDTGRETQEIVNDGKNGTVTNQTTGETVIEGNKEVDSDKTADTLAQGKTEVYDMTKKESMQDEDALVSIRPIRDVQDVVLMTENGFVLRFPAEEVSEKKKGAVGVRGMKLQKNDSVEEVYLFEEGTESKVIFHEKEVTLNRLKRAKRDGTGTRMRK